MPDELYLFAGPIIEILGRQPQDLRIGFGERVKRPVFGNDVVETRAIRVA